MTSFRKPPSHGRAATRGQIESMYAPMRGGRPPLPPAPPICPRCTNRLDEGTGYCGTCKAWPLLNKDQTS